MPDARETQLIREATDIFLRLRDNPDDFGLQQERDDFLARGAAERSAYQKMLQAWKVTEPTKKTGPTTLSSVVFAGLIIATGYFAFEPARTALLADLSSRSQTKTAQLASGDQVVIDAASALIDDTENADRHVTLLRGAAYFDVVSNSRPFVVSTGNIRVEVTGTSFEVGQLDDEEIVTVTEGAVDVTIGDLTRQLVAGNQLSWSDDDGVRVTDIDITRAVGWRENTLVADGMTFGQIVAILERRIPGEILIASSALAQTPVVGTFDLNDPDSSLDLLIALTGAKAASVPYVMTIIRP